MTHKRKFRLTLFLGLLTVLWIASGNSAEDQHWSSSGRYLLYHEKQPGGRRVKVHDMVKGQFLQMDPKTGYETAYGVMSSDETKVAYAEFEGKGSKPTVQLYDLASKRTETVAKGVPEAWSPDGRYLVISKPEVGAREGHQYTQFLWLHDLETGDSVKIDVPGGGEPQFDPAGERLIIAGTLGLALYSLRTHTVLREWREERTSMSEEAYTYPQWSPDGRYIAFTKTVDVLPKEGPPDMVHLDAGVWAVDIETDSLFPLIDDPDQDERLEEWREDSTIVYLEDGVRKEAIIDLTRKERD